MSLIRDEESTIVDPDVPYRNRSGQLVAITWLLVSLAAAFVCIRFACKRFLLKCDLGKDDWFILAATISVIPSAFISHFGLAANGLGRDIWTLQPEKITRVLMYFYVIALMYFWDTALVKLSMICFYQRIFKAKYKLLQATFFATIAWATAFILAAIFQCRPVNYFWTQWDGKHRGSCSDANAIAWAHAAINIAIDIWMLAVPMWELPGLQLHWKKKAGVAIMFILGTLVTIVSGLRLQALIRFAKTTNSTWDYYDICFWSTIEVTLGIICACLPAMRTIPMNLCPRLATSTRCRAQRLRQYGSRLQSNNREGPANATIAKAERGTPYRGAESSSHIFVQYSFSTQGADLHVPLENAISDAHAYSRV